MGSCGVVGVEEGSPLCSASLGVAACQSRTAGRSAGTRAADVLAGSAAAVESQHQCQEHPAVRAAVAGSPAGSKGCPDSTRRRARVCGRWAQYYGGVASRHLLKRVAKQNKK